MKAFPNLIFALVCGAASACAGGDNPRDPNLQTPAADQAAPFNAEPAAIGGDEAAQRADPASPTLGDRAEVCRASCGEQCNEECVLACQYCADPRVAQCVSSGEVSAEDNEDRCYAGLAACVIQFSCATLRQLEGDSDDVEGE